MAWHLFRLGRWSFQHRRIVAGVWVLLLVVVAAGAATLSGRTDDSFELSGIESTQAFDLIEQRNPQAAPDGATARIVYEAPAGEQLTDPANRAAVTDSLERLGGTEVQSVVDPFAAQAVSPNGRVGYATISYDTPAIDLPAAAKQDLRDVVRTAEASGLRVAVGGDAVQAETEAPTGEALGVVVALVVLTLTFGSLLAAGMPLLTALLGVGIGMLSITTLTGFVHLSSTTPALGTMLGLAVGIDYALFIMSRYRHETALGRPLAEAAGRAVGTAGSAVVFAGLTVVIALVGLAVCGIGFLTQMGLAAAFMVVLSVLIALTLLPAILGFAGDRVARGRGGRRSTDPEGDAGHGLARRWVELVSRRRWPALVAGVVVACVVAVPVASLQLALPDDGTKPADDPARVAYDLIATNFGAGVNGPLVVVVDTQGSDDAEAAVDRATQELQQLAAEPGSDIAAVVPALASDDPAAQQEFSQRLDATQLATIAVVPRSGPSDESTKELVTDLRTALDALPAETGARALVTGQTAVGVDISAALADVFPIYLLVVVGLAVLLLVVVFRSVWVPVKAALGFLLSVGVSLGSTVAVFQWGWLDQVVGVDTTGPVLFLLPILLTGILFGLAMDYEVFLVTRMREAHVHGTPARQAVVDGFVHSARVVVAAALIMVGVFTGFALSGDTILKTIGFALAVGVLADAFLVRMLIVPAVMAIVGERIWWMPRWLDRVVPDVDVEGEGLTRRLGADAPGPVTVG